MMEFYISALTMNRTRYRLLLKNDIISGHKYDELMKLIMHSTEIIVYV